MNLTYGCLILFALTLAVPPSGRAQNRPPQAPKPVASEAVEQRASLPIKRIVLYKSGVGYFEHVGRVRDNQDVTISFTSGQLDDVLKTLTVLDLGGGRITSVGYNSAAPVERQLGDLHLPSDKSTLGDFLGALRGARVEVRSGTSTITGRILSVEHKNRVANNVTLDVEYVSLLIDSGEVKTAEVSQFFSVRLLERGLASKVERLLDVVASGREPDLRRMSITTEGSGERSLFVSYISEVPVWKATYRIVLPSKPDRRPLLQGWAIVDNTVGQDWDRVQLALVAGAPQSFIQKISQPYYSRRPVVPLPDQVAMSPQTYESTLAFGAAVLAGTITDPSGAVVPNATVKVYDAVGTVLAETRTNASGAYEFAALADGVVRIEANSPGFNRSVVNGVSVADGRTTRQDVVLSLGAVTQTVEVSAAAPTVNTSSSSLARGARSVGSGGMLGSGAGLGSGRGSGGGVGFGSGGGIGPGVVVAARAAMPGAAAAQELGDLFEYKLKEPISIQKNRSALVPIINAAIDAEKVSIWNEQARTARPTRALWLTNSSGLTLDGGSFSVIQDETFAGEGLIEPIKAGERRLISYAADLALNATSRQRSEPQRVTRVRVNRGAMIHESEVREEKTYTFRNEDSAERTVLIEHPVRSGYELRGDAKPAETTAGWMRFRLSVGPKQTASLTVAEARPIQASFALTDLTPDQVAIFVGQKSIDKTIEAALARILEQKALVADLDDRKEALDGETQKIFDDQQRLRENMKALKGSMEEKALLQRYTQQLNQQENRLEELRKQVKDLESRHDAAKAALDKMIQELSLDVKL